MIGPKDPEDQYEDIAGADPFDNTPDDAEKIRLAKHIMDRALEDEDTEGTFDEDKHIRILVRIYTHLYTQGFQEDEAVRISVKLLLMRERLLAEIERIEQAQKDSES